MKLTVGPLAPAVYWRRRAVVLGALLFVVFLIAYSCSGSDPSGAANVHGTSGSRSAAPSGSPSPSASTVLTLPLNTEPTGSASSSQPQGPPAGGGGGPASGPCTDADMSVVAVPDPATVKQGVATIRQGTSIKISMKIKNISNRSCTRDVGASAQELYVAQGSTKAWSSDACDALTGTDTRTFGPGIEIEPYVVWNARATSSGCANRPWAAIGTYQIVGRLGSKLSDPVPLQITA
jgi:hypothetical protein